MAETDSLIPVPQLLFRVPRKGFNFWADSICDCLCHHFTATELCEIFSFQSREQEGTFSTLHLTAAHEDIPVNITPGHCPGGMEIHPSRDLLFSGIKEKKPVGKAGSPFSRFFLTEEFCVTFRG